MRYFTENLVRQGALLDVLSFWGLDDDTLAQMLPNFNQNKVEKWFWRLVEEEPEQYLRYGSPKLVQLLFDAQGQIHREVAMTDLYQLYQAHNTLWQANVAAAQRDWAVARERAQGALAEVLAQDYYGWAIGGVYGLGADTVRIQLRQDGECYLIFTGVTESSTSGLTPGMRVAYCEWGVTADGLFTLNLLCRSVDGAQYGEIAVVFADGFCKRRAPEVLAANEQARLLAEGDGELAALAALALCGPMVQSWQYDPAAQQLTMQLKTAQGEHLRLVFRQVTYLAAQRSKVENGSHDWAYWQEASTLRRLDEHCYQQIIASEMETLIVTFGQVSLYHQQSLLEWLSAAE